MTRHARTGWVSLVTGLALFSVPVPTEAQQGPQLIRQGIGAYNDFDPARALPLLRRGVDPRAGPQDSVWALGVQYLAQILVEQGDETTARAWANWAVRLRPNLQLDTLNLLSQVIAMFESARGAVTTSADDSLATTQWIWPAGGADPGAAQGSVEVQPGAVPATVLVLGRGVLSPRLYLPAGTYELQATAPAYRSLKVSREVLPGITTQVAFNLQPEAPVAVEVAPAQPVAPPPALPQPAQVSTKKKGFPWVIAVLGAGGAAAAVAVLAGGGGETNNLTTGSILIRFRDP